MSQQIHQGSGVTHSRDPGWFFYMGLPRFFFIGSLSYVKWLAILGWVSHRCSPLLDATWSDCGQRAPCVWSFSQTTHLHRRARPRYSAVRVLGRLTARRPIVAHAETEAALGLLVINFGHRQTKCGPVIDHPQSNKTLRLYPGRATRRRWASTEHASRDLSARFAHCRRDRRELVCQLRPSSKKKKSLPLHHRRLFESRTPQRKDSPRTTGQEREQERRSTRKKGTLRASKAARPNMPRSPPALSVDNINNHGCSKHGYVQTS